MVAEGTGSNTRRNDVAQGKRVEREGRNHLMRPIMRMVAVMGMTAAMVGGGATTAAAQSTIGTGIQAEGEVACGYDKAKCVRQWYDYAYVKNYIVSELYYRGGGYHFYWWN